MLVVSRKLDERIVILLRPLQPDEPVTQDDVVEICLTATREGRARIGVQAPKRLIVHRKEIFEQVYGPIVEEKR